MIGYGHGRRSQGPSPPSRCRYFATGADALLTAVIGAGAVAAPQRGRRDRGGFRLRGEGAAPGSQKEPPPSSRRANWEGRRSLWAYKMPT